jgi:VIT1/CCC1 family predicted Fe2+/Mn2+ transporter
VREAIEAHLGTHQVARVIYGAIIGLALVVALEQHPPPAGAVVATLLGTAVAVALAELYSDVIGAEVRTHRRIPRQHLAQLLEDVVAVGLGISFPAVFFVLAAVGAMELDSAFAVAKWTGLGLIAFYGFCAARLSGAGLRRSLLQALAVALIGAFVIALKALVH